MPPRRKLPTWFAWLDMVATLSLAVLVLAVLMSAGLVWAMVAALPIAALRAVHLAWTWRLLARDRADGGVTAREEKREKLTSSALAAAMMACIAAMFVVSWRGDSALRDRFARAGMPEASAGSIFFDPPFRPERHVRW